jgi:hypothetical protein
MGILLEIEQNRYSIGGNIVKKQYFYATMLQELRKMNFTKSVMTVVVLAVLTSSLPIHSVFDFFPNTSVGFIVDEDLTDTAEDTSGGNIEEIDEQDILFSESAFLFHPQPICESGRLLLNVARVPQPFFEIVAPPPKG